jgi:hypothetical protein
VFGSFPFDRPMKVKSFRGGICGLLVLVGLVVVAVDA